MPLSNSPQPRTVAETPSAKAARRAEGLGRSRIGPYALEAVLGEGGMGTVYRATQLEPVRRTVALKVIRAGQATTERILARFELERQVLALMQHPNIAHLIDAGKSPDGEPFFVMEHVDGPALVEYCDQRRLSVTERLRLFLEVCAGIQHAHQKGVIHRDIKPSNVLVAEVDGRAVPKVIDFGVAKAIAGDLATRGLETQLDVMVGTLAFMSPEQLDRRVLADLDTRSDVYALGALLYVLLAGVPAFTDREPGRLVEAILRQEPSRLSTRLRELGEASTEIATRRGTEPPSLLRVLAGDLQWIVARALEKNPADRYPAVSELAADVERYLADRPVLASPPQLGLRIKKFVRRNRLAVGAASLVAVALVAAVVATSLALFRARESAERATREAAKSLAANEFLNGMLASAAPGEQGRDVKVIDVLDRAADELGTRFAAEPEVEASLRETLGRTYRRLGELPLALAQFERARELLRALHGDEHPETLTIRTARAGVLVDAGRLAEAEPELQAVVARLGAIVGPTDPKLVDARQMLGWLYREMGKGELAEKEFRDLVAILSASFGREAEVTLQVSGGHALVLHDLKRFDEARAYYDGGLLASFERVLGPEAPDSLIVRNNYANLLLDLGRSAEAAAVLAATLPVAERVHGPEHLETLTLRHNWIRALLAAGKPVEAEALARANLAIRLRVLGPEHPHTLYSRSAVGGTLAAQKRWAEAEADTLAVYRDTLRILGADHNLTKSLVARLQKISEATGRKVPGRTQVR
ncbi:MAG: serine/threonine-protein kinase, partial [Thermoanaerobaculia bacterium]|nr:serine/threonine-protein kinase [Thermoanaerobaculia bacterium]